MGVYKTKKRAITIKKQKRGSMRQNKPKRKHTKTSGQQNKKTNKQKDKKTSKQNDKQTKRQTDKQTTTKKKHTVFIDSWEKKNMKNSGQVTSIIRIVGHLQVTKLWLC